MPPGLAGLDIARIVISPVRDQSTKLKSGLSGGVVGRLMSSCTRTVKERIRPSSSGRRVIVLMNEGKLIGWRCGWEYNALMPSEYSREHVRMWETGGYRFHAVHSGERQDCILMKNIKG
jgi:hypothetical protein